MQSPPLTYQYKIRLQEILYFDRNTGNSGTNESDFDPGADVVITGLVIQIIPNDSRLPELTIRQGDSALQDPNNDGNYVDNDFIKTYGNSKNIGKNQILAAAAKPIQFDLTDPNGSGIISGEYPVVGQSTENGFFYPPVSFPILHELHDLELYRDLDEFMDEGGTIQEFNPRVFDKDNIIVSTPNAERYREIIRDGFEGVPYQINNSTDPLAPFDPEIHLADGRSINEYGAVNAAHSAVEKYFTQTYDHIETRIEPIEGGFHAFKYPSEYTVQANAFIDNLLGISPENEEAEPEEDVSPNVLDPELLGPFVVDQDYYTALDKAGIEAIKEGKFISRTTNIRNADGTVTTIVNEEPYQVQFFGFRKDGVVKYVAVAVPYDYAFDEEIMKQVQALAGQQVGLTREQSLTDADQLQQETERLSLIDRLKRNRQKKKDQKAQRKAEEAALEQGAENLNNDLPSNLQENVNTRVVDGRTVEGGGRGILKPTKEQKQAARKKRIEERKKRKEAAKLLKQQKKNSNNTRVVSGRNIRRENRADFVDNDLTTRTVSGRGGDADGRGIVDVRDQQRAEQEAIDANARIAGGRSRRRDRREDFLNTNTRYVSGRGGDADGRGVIRTQVNQRTVSGRGGDIDGRGVIRTQVNQRTVSGRGGDIDGRGVIDTRERDRTIAEINEFNTRTATGRSTNERKENKRKSRKLFLKTFGPYTKTITGRIIDSETNKSIEGANIEFVTYFEGELLLTYEAFQNGEFAGGSINNVIRNLSRGQNDGRYREQYRSHLAYRLNPETGLKEIDPFYEETVGLDNLFKPGSGPREEVVSITTGRNGRFKINVYSGEDAGPAVLKIGAEGYITIDKPAVGKDGSKRFNLGTIPLDPDPGLDADDAILENSPTRIKRRQKRRLARLEKLDLRDAKNRASFQDNMLNNLLKKALGLLIPFGITAGLAVLKKLNPFDDINAKCPSDDKLDELIKKRNNLKSAIEAAYVSIEAATLTIELTNGFINATRLLLNGLTAIPFPLGVTVPATAVTTLSSQIEDRKKDIPRLQEISTSILTYLVLLGALLQTILRLLQIVDSAIQKCKQEANLPPVNPDLLSLIEPEVEQGIPTFRGFRFKIEVENTTSQYKRRRAAAIDVNGVVVLRSEYSFSDDTNILIEELKFYITQNDLKAE